MSFSIGRNIIMTVKGSSHSEYMEVALSGIARDLPIDFQEIDSLLCRRQGAGGTYNTSRVEKDRPEILQGIDAGRATGDVIIARFANQNVRRNDYGQLVGVPRPSHADYAAWIKYKGGIDLSGGGFFSGRMTLPMVFAGGICKGILKEKNIQIGAHIAGIGHVRDRSYNATDNTIESSCSPVLPVLDKEALQSMEALMNSVAAGGDSIGGIIECKVINLPVGMGSPIYDSVESLLAHGIFSIPAVKGIEFGQGFETAYVTGSESNDQFCIKNNKITCMTNNSGGIQGGLTNGMPVIFRVAIKPTPSIHLPQRTVDLNTMEEKIITVGGRHDACIVPRAVPCVEAMTALVLWDIMAEDY